MAKRKSAFDRCVESVTAKGSADDPRAVCAVAGVRKYGQAEMTRRSIAGRRNAGLANPEEDSPRAFWKERNDGKYHVQFVYPRSGQRVSKIMTREKFEEMKSSGKYLVYHSNPDDARWGRGNPFEEAAALSEAFHGRRPESVDVYSDELHVHSTLADFGALLGLYITEDAFFRKHPMRDGKPTDCVEVRYNGTRLGFNEKPVYDESRAIWVYKQAYMVGGDQSLEVADFPWSVDALQESADVGYIAFIEYETAKFHLGKQDRTPGPYVHHFSEETKGRYPLLAYDTVNLQGAFVGGSYYVTLDMDGKYSAGIRD